ncbi:hypothetical protein IL306_015023 [Fusarium sp. DS 682]|nr:hypothetical protein IL306_015023 [Fusarium sp. DS 682]
MGDASVFKYPSPLTGYENAPPLPDEKAADGKSYVNPPSEKLSEAQLQTQLHVTYLTAVSDIHIYYLQTNESQVKYAKELWERIRREFPELRIYKLWEGPIGPHPIAMFEVNVFNPAQFGAFVAWLAIWRGPLSALVHPNVIPEKGVNRWASMKRDHLERAIWMGERLPLDASLFNREN